jgi:predicted ATPase
LLFRQGVPPHATYLFKHALVQDAAYGTLLREPRRALHARIAETLESGFTVIAENQPEILARHCTEAGLIEKAAGLWGKAGHAQSSTSAADAALFADMLSLLNDGRYPALELTPQQRRERTLGALTAQVETLARKSPVLMIFEDAHWADPTSL